MKIIRLECEAQINLFSHKNSIDDFKYMINLSYTWCFTTHFRSLKKKTEQNGVLNIKLIKIMQIRPELSYIWEIQTSFHNCFDNCSTYFNINFARLSDFVMLSFLLNGFATKITGSIYFLANPRWNLIRNFYTH